MKDSTKIELFKCLTILFGFQFLIPNITNPEFVITPIISFSAHVLCGLMWLNGILFPSSKKDKTNDILHPSSKKGKTDDNDSQVPSKD